MIQVRDGGKELQRSFLVVIITHDNLYEDYHLNDVRVYDRGRVDYLRLGHGPGFFSKDEVCVPVYYFV